MADRMANVSESVGASWNLRAKEVEEAWESGNTVAKSGIHPLAIPAA